MSKSKKIIIGIIVVILIIGAGFVMLQKPGEEGLSNDNTYQAQSTQDVFAPDQSNVTPNLQYWRDQIFHPNGGGG